MTELHIKNKEPIQRIASKHSLNICEIIWNFFKKMFTSNKKIVIRSRCKESCCCKNCSCIAALDEKEEDDSSDDIVITNDDVRIS